MKLERLFTVPQQAIAFLGAVAVCLVLLMIIYVFLTKTLCFSKKSSAERTQPVGFQSFSCCPCI